MLTFKEFCNLNNPIDPSSKQIILSLFESYPYLRSHPVAVRLNENTEEDVSLDELLDINRVLMKRSKQLSVTAPKANFDEKQLIIIEQNYLTASSQALTTILMFQLHRNFSQLIKHVNGGV